jgi:hypothetical protein
MKKTIILDERYPFYSGYTFRESMQYGGPITVKVSCDCVGQMIPGDKYRVELCPIHEKAAQNR